MSRLPLLSALLLLLWPLAATAGDAAPPPAQDQRIGDTFTTPDGVDIDFFTLLPPDFDANGTYPVVLAFGPGNEGYDGVDYVLTHFWGPQASRRGWIVVAPQRTSDGWRSVAGAQQMAALLDELAQRFHLEGGKFHLGGASVGADSAFYLAQQMPERFHSLTVIRGRAEDAHLERLRGLHVRMYVGERERASLNEARRTHERLRKLGIDSELEIVRHQRYWVRTLVGDTVIKDMEAFRTPGPEATD